MYQLEHHWLSFTAWDIIMPLFLFTSGLSMPFSFGKYLGKGHNKGQLYRKVLKRFCLLFLLGWIAQGNLLDLDLNTFHVYCNTLHAIAFGYLITAVIVLNVSKLKFQLTAGVALLLSYWALLTFIGDVHSETGNIAAIVDKAVLGRFDDGGYYTWLLSSLGFGATVISGYFAGLILKRSDTQVQKLKTLSIVGVTLAVSGLLWTLQMPMIKPIWSPSMILLSSGLCFLLLALSFLLTDKMKLTGWLITGLRVLGLNSIAAYMLYESFNLQSVSHTLLHGFKQYIGAFYPALVAAGAFAILWLILWFMYKHKIYLKV
jgi:predicted acyltransferase